MRDMRKLSEGMNSWYVYADGENTGIIESKKEPDWLNNFEYYHEAVDDAVEYLEQKMLNLEWAIKKLKGEV